MTKQQRSTRPIQKLLIANRGEIACRIMRSAHQMGITCVAVFSNPDANMPFVKEADEAVHLFGETAGETYLKSDLIVQAAKQTNADAVHPGYGFLSENAAFAKACIDAGLIFVGPPPEAIQSMGSKLEAKQLMASNGVPVLLGKDVSNLNEQQLKEAVNEIGLPILIKATYGGGGRGMRIVHNYEELAVAVESAQREAQSAFGNPSVFLERYLESARHIEIQIFGDLYGNIVHLFERECSIQRHHQKIVEESPSTAVSPELREVMGKAAVTAGMTVGYVGAGTVEFMLASNDSSNDEFFFLEMNTRLQVEHPVTELITGLDLVKIQLLVAQGMPLSKEVFDASITGHAIETRLYAENPTKNWMGSMGTLHRFQFKPDKTNDQSILLRVDSGVEDGSVVSPYYDSMLAKVIAYAPTRIEAARVLENALGKAHIHGLATNRELLINILRCQDFLDGKTDTGFLERHSPEELSVNPLAEEATQLSAIAAALASQARNRVNSKVLSHLSSGWRNNPSEFQQISYETDQGRIDIKYRFERNRWTIYLAKQDASKSEDAPTPNLYEQKAVDLISCTATEVAFEYLGVRRSFDIHQVDSTTYVDSVLGAVELSELPRFPPPKRHIPPGSLIAPMPGVIIKVAVEQGETVETGQPLVIMEAMKMEHAIQAPAPGKVTDIYVEVNQQVSAGDIVATVVDLIEQLSNSSPR
ncbi:MAG: biotin/lipoyl-binding protein [Actinobacteria bacterium]|nr:biotin/lipoyl-binding protein [Actinomycetota bacterium]MCL6105255.1 biotin/lipoyl-binding protein [Actinomycetota bacterium]